MLQPLHDATFTASPPDCGRSVGEPAMKLLYRYGYDAVCWQNLSPEVELWFARRHEGMIGFVVSDDFLIAAGTPLAAPENLAAVADEFRVFGMRQGRGICFLCAQRSLATVFAGHGYSSICLGAQPVWNPKYWGAVVRGHKGLREQLRRARAKHIVIEPLTADAAAVDIRLEACLRAWLHGRWYGMKFLADPYLVAQRVGGRLVFTARRMGENALLAFLVASPVPARNGYHLELIARSPAAPNGTTELLIHSAMEDMAWRQVDYATLGLVALSQNCREAWNLNPRWFKLASGMATRFGQRLYHFASLEAFRSRLHPDFWEPVYAISGESTFTPLAALAAAKSLFTLPGHRKVRGNSSSFLANSTRQW